MLFDFIYWSKIEVEEEEEGLPDFDFIEWFWIYNSEFERRVMQWGMSIQREARWILIAQPLFSFCFHFSLENAIFGVLYFDFWHFCPLISEAVLVQKIG